MIPYNGSSFTLSLILIIYHMLQFLKRRIRDLDHLSDGPEEIRAKYRSIDELMTYLSVVLFDTVWDATSNNHLASLDYCDVEQNVQKTKEIIDELSDCLVGSDTSKWMNDTFRKLTLLELDSITEILGHLRCVLSFLCQQNGTLVSNQLPGKQG